MVLLQSQDVNNNQEVDVTDGAEASEDGGENSNSAEHYRTGAETTPNLNGLSREQAEKALKDSGFRLTKDRPNWKTYQHIDGSKIDISAEGRVVRTQAPKYGLDGSRINKGQRVDYNGNEIPRNIDHKEHPSETLGS